MNDHNFDNIAAKFVKNIYGSGKGRIRTEILWDELLHCLSLLPDRPLRILDAGGGFGYFSQKLAALGHQVVLCDISSELLRVAETQIQDQKYAQNIQLLHCSIQRLPELVEGQFDLILNHAVLEWLVDPKQTLQGLLNFLNVEGLCSLMFYNKEAQRFHNLVSGNFDFVAKGMLRKNVVRLTPTNPIVEAEVTQWLAEVEMQVVQKTGVRVIHDYLKEPCESEEKFVQLLAMEKLYCHQEPYASLGRYTHLIVKHSGHK
ncbi:methyltransferase domain-containing protein [Psychromonas sp.]|uniref:methyltransferase domain-containing protein n=1 Tax=Psychromonas sp. TaxID=1884585 RepID=UPI0035627B3E